MGRPAKSDTPDAAMLAVLAGDVSLLKSAIANGAELSPSVRNGISLLVLAATQGFESVVDILLSAGMDVNASDARGGMTALHAAASKGNEGLVRKLILAGGDVNRQFSDPPITALSIAFRKRFDRIVQLLLEAKADPNISINLPADPLEARGTTPLIYASSIGDLESATLLLTHGADPNKVKDDGVSPLMAAVLAGNSAMAKLLLQFGSDATTGVRQADGKIVSARELAEAIGNPEIIQLLRN